MLATLDTLLISDHETFLIHQKNMSWIAYTCQILWHSEWHILYWHFVENSSLLSSWCLYNVSGISLYWTTLGILLPVNRCMPTFNKRHEVSAYNLTQLQYCLCWGIQTIKVKSVLQTTPPQQDIISNLTLTWEISQKHKFWSLIYTSKFSLTSPLDKENLLTVHTSKFSLTSFPW